MVNRLQRPLALLLLTAVLLVLLPFRAEAKAPGRYPVVFIPGMAGTELYNGNELVWVNTWRLLGSQVPILNLFQLSWLLPLRLATDGVTPHNPESRILPGDVMRRNLSDIYSPFIDSLKQEGYVEGRDLFLFPYDWRKELTMTADALGKRVDEALRVSGASQVILVSHSMGGLVARDYVVRGGAPKVKASITMATPWLGAPMAYRALAYGWDMGLKLPGTRWAAVAPKDIKLLTQNFPAVYQLAPARQFFDFYPEGYLARGGRSLSYADSVSRGLGAHNRVLAASGEGYYNRLLDGSSHGVLQFVLAGRGRQTVGAVTERKDWLGMTHKTERMVDGDEVVPVLSADLGYSQDPARPERYLGLLEAVAYAGDAHTFFTSSPAVRATVSTWIRSVNMR